MLGQQREQLLMAQHLIAAFPLPTLIVGEAQVVVALNDSARELLGKTVLGRHFTTALRHPKLVAAVEQGLIKRAPQTVVHQIVENGNNLTYNVHLQAITDTDLLLLSFENVSNVEQAEQMRRDFVANVSHELRTPLTAVIGFIETLRGAARNDANARDHFLAVMADEADRMNRLVGRLLSLSRVEMEERVRPTRRIDLHEVLQTTLQRLDPVAMDNDVTVHLLLGAEPLPVRGDTDQLIQVFTNIVENAIKYGGTEKTVSVTAKRALHDPVLRGPAIEISIADQGAGIDPIHLPRLTERFYRVDGHRSREVGGTGLGLAIVKHILNRHRGRLKVISQMGQGSQFTVILPPDVGIF